MIYGNNTKIKRGVSLAAFVIFLFSSAFVFADPKDLDDIRHAIKAKGAKWHADKTSVSELSDEEKKRRLGGHEFEDLLAEALVTSETAPIPMIESSLAQVDWRSVEGFSYVTPVKNQGSCGSCWAFATTAGLESQVMIGTQGTQIDLSEQILVSCSGAGSCSGGSSATASNFLRDVGLPLETCFRYTAADTSCDNACLNWQDDTYKINGWHRASTDSITVEDMRNALYAYGPFIATMYVYNDFYSYRSGVYSYTSGSYLGSHAVLVVGYDDTLQAFIVKNSWGTGWGEAGFFMIAYSEVTGSSHFGYSAMVYDGYGDTPVPDPSPVPAPEPEPEPDPEPDPQPCSYSLSSNGATFKARGGKGSFTLYAQGSCPIESLTPTSSNSWVEIISTDHASSSISIGYFVYENSGDRRSAAIDVAGLSHIVKQLAAKTVRSKPDKVTRTERKSGRSLLRNWAPDK